MLEAYAGSADPHPDRPDSFAPTCRGLIMAWAVLMMALPAAVAFLAPPPAPAGGRASEARAAPVSSSFLFNHQPTAKLASVGIRPRFRLAGTISCASMSSSGVVTGDGWAALVNWVTKSGGWVSSKVVAGSIEGGERGVYALDKVSGPIAYIPLGCCITAEEGIPPPEDVLEALGGSAEGVSEAHQLAVKLLIEAGKKDASAYAAYIDTLPPPVSILRHTSTTLTFGREPRSIPLPRRGRPTSSKQVAPHFSRSSSSSSSIGATLFSP